MTTTRFPSLWRTLRRQQSKNGDCCYNSNNLNMALLVNKIPFSFLTLEDFFAGQRQARRKFNLALWSQNLGDNSANLERNINNCIFD